MCVISLKFGATVEAVAKSNVCATRWPAREKVIFSITKFFKSFRRILVCKVPLRRTFATLLSCVILERKSNDIVRNSNETSLFWGYGLLVMLWLVRLKLPRLRSLKNSTCQTEKIYWNLKWTHCTLSLLCLFSIEAFLVVIQLDMTADNERTM